MRYGLVMAQYAGRPESPALERLERLHDEDRRMLAALHRHHGLALARIDLRLTAIEEKLAKSANIVKIAIGFGVPVLVLLMTGNMDAAIRVLAVFFGNAR